ncbi:hypothetical protein UFOVP760_69 [uncultured Caudovirales phage]|uniref:Uncharacterized protein n=1 Tax=uncultured Caudovirales phage TaxID=2100421 RepID=A0A6J7X624_9CAUD|nr:hypothetical protein UFOVP760_69 [uncultured Caudovirales phage]
MSITFTLRPAETVTIDEVEILAVRDLFLEKKIVARVKGLLSPIVLWDGEEEYTAAGNWTNETAISRANEILNSGNVRFL